MPVGVLPGLEVVADEHRVEPDLFGEARKIQQLARPELFGRGFISEFKQRQLLFAFVTSGLVPEVPEELPRDARDKPGHDESSFVPLWCKTLIPSPAHPRGSVSCW